MWYRKYKRLGFFLLVSTFHIMSWKRSKGMPFQIDSEGEVRKDWVAKLLLEADKVESGGHVDVDGEIYRSLSTFGSRPPNCARKCGRCSPCTAIQVPAFTDHFRTQYANYEPEGWKCKCGSTVYDP